MSMELTIRQTKIILLLSRGYYQGQAAAQLDIPLNTLKGDLKVARQVLRCRTTAQMVAMVAVAHDRRKRDTVS